MSNWAEVRDQILGEIRDRYLPRYPHKHAAHPILHQVQGRQRDGLLARVARQIGLDALPQFFAEKTHRSNSAAMMFRLPSTATTSLS